MTRKPLLSLFSHCSLIALLPIIGLSVFHKVQVASDTSNKLPSTLLLTINHRGVHLLSARSHKHLGSLQFRDVAEYGCIGDVLTLSARIGGELHRFGFTTPSGTEISEAMDIAIADAVQRAAKGDDRASPRLDEGEQMARVRALVGRVSSGKGRASRRVSFSRQSR